MRSSPDTDSGFTCLGFAFKEVIQLCTRNWQIFNFHASICKMRRQQQRKGCRNLVVCTWNVRTLVENSGDLHICRKRQVLSEGDSNNYSTGVDRKLDLVAGELKRYGISVAGIQETKWFGTDAWPAAEGFTFLHSGRPLPDSNEDAVRNEGVGIMLDPKATVA